MKKSGRSEAFLWTIWRNSPRVLSTARTSLRGAASAMAELLQAAFLEDLSRASRPAGTPRKPCGPEARILPRYLQPCALLSTSRFYFPCYPRKARRVFQRRIYPRARCSAPESPFPLRPFFFGKLPVLNAAGLYHDNSLFSVRRAHVSGHSCDKPFLIQSHIRLGNSLFWAYQT